MSKDTSVIGIPTMALLPAKHFRFSVDEEKHKITIPKSGMYKDIDSEFFTDVNGSFVVSETIEDGLVVNVSTISSVLFAAQKYPDIKYNQLFCPAMLIVEDNSIVIIGSVVTMLPPEEK